MDAKTYCKKTAAFAGWLIQNVPADLDEKTMVGWMNNPDGTKKFLSRLKSPVETTKPTTLFSVVATYKLKDGSIISTLAPSREWTFAEAAATVLGIGAGTGTATLGKALIENGHTMTSAQVEEMGAATDQGKKTDMRTDSWGNFHFAEDEDGSVSVGNVIRASRGWGACVYLLDNGGRWYADSRLLVRNLSDALKL